MQDQFISTFVSMRWLEMRLCSGDRSTHDSDFAINGDHEHAVRVEIPPVEPHFLCNSATLHQKIFDCKISMRPTVNGHSLRKSQLWTVIEIAVLY